jgi:hypothetical protein
MELGHYHTLEIRADRALRAIATFIRSPGNNPPNDYQVSPSGFAQQDVKRCLVALRLDLGKGMDMSHETHEQQDALQRCDSPHALEYNPVLTEKAEHARGLRF